LALCLCDSVTKSLCDSVAKLLRVSVAYYAAFLVLLRLRSGIGASVRRAR